MQNKKDFLNILLNTIDELCSENNVTYTSEKIDEYIHIKFSNFTLGLISIIIQQNKQMELQTFVVRGFHKEIMVLVNHAEIYDEVFNIPVFKCLLDDEESHLVNMAVAIKTW